MHPCNSVWLWACQSLPLIISNVILFPTTQVTIFQFDDGATASFNMVAFTKRLCAREVKIYGTKGEIVFEDGWNNVEVFDFLTQQTSKFTKI